MLMFLFAMSAYADKLMYDEKITINHSFYGHQCCSVTDKDSENQDNYWLYCQKIDKNIMINIKQDSYKHGCSK